LNKITTIQISLICAIAFFLPLSPSVIPFLIIGFAITWILQGDFRQRLKKLKLNYLAYLFMFYYVLHLIGMLYTDNISAGSFDLETKLSILIMPVLFATSKPMPREQINRVFQLFVIGNLVAVIFCLANAFYMYGASEDIGDFFYGSLSLFYHASYFAMYLSLSIAILVIYLIENRTLFPKYGNFISMALAILFAGFIILLSAKSGVITLLVIIGILAVYYTIGKKNYLKGTVIILVTVTGVASLIMVSPVVQQRIDGMIMIWNTDTDSLNKESIESNTARRFVWQAVAEVIEDNWLIGTGTGDVKDVLVKKYESKGFVGIQQERLNAHNQFLQSFAALGLLGVIVLILCIVWPMWIGIKNKHYLVSLFLLIILINALTESILEVQAGIIFYAFFNSLLTFHILKNPGFES